MPSGSPFDLSGTITSGLRNEELEERRRALRAVLAAGVIAWPSFAIADVIPALQQNGASLTWTLGWRALGELIAILGLLAVTHRPALTARDLLIIDQLIFGLGSAFVALIAVPTGGLATRSMQGVMLLATVRATYVPSPWKRALFLSLPTVFAFPATMALAATWDPHIRAQWTDRADLDIFLYDLLFIIAGTVMGSIGSHILYTARRQVWEARKLGHYRLKARIGGGGMGDVWLARHDPLDRAVALKVLRGGAARDEESVRRFVREARAASRLRHPNTIRVFDFGASDDGVFYIAMELLDGLDLESIVADGGPIPGARAIRFGRQICSSLAEAHELGIVHRDVKPANLFVTQIGDEFDFVKVLDFGVAHVARDQTLAPASGREAKEDVVGTPAYLSPEMVTGDPVDARSDLYSLGAVLYFMVTGSPLFPNKSFRDTLLAHAMHDPLPPSARADDISPDLERVILKCLAKQPAFRYQTSRELELDLAACADASKWDNEAARSYWTGLRPSVRLRSRG